MSHPQAPPWVGHPPAHAAAGHQRLQCTSWPGPGALTGWPPPAAPWHPGPLSTGPAAQVARGPSPLAAVSVAGWSHRASSPGCGATGRIGCGQTRPHPAVSHCGAMMLMTPVRPRRYIGSGCKLVEHPDLCSRWTANTYTSLQLNVSVQLTASHRFVTRHKVMCVAGGTCTSCMFTNLH